MKIALCQLSVTEDKTKNIKRACDMLHEAKALGAEMAVLPEMFCIKYRTELFCGAAEEIPGGEAYKMLKDTSEKLNMAIVGGSVPERDGERLYNTCMCFAKNGELAGIYRKAHLFDVDFEGLRFMESDTFSVGENPPLILDEPVKTGVSVCFDIRFPQWAKMICDAGAVLYALPAAFAVKTGKKHWELLLRARAVDNQLFTVGVAPAASSCTYGHSMLVAPDGEVICDLGEDENVYVADIDLTQVEKMRRSIPIL